MQPYFEAVDPGDQDRPAPIIVALDNGRAKIFSAAISSSAIKKPTSMAFTRRRYYFEMGHQRNRRWESERTSARPMVTTVSLTGGLRNCDIEKWRAFLEVSRDNDEVLHAEYVQGSSIVEDANVPVEATQPGSCDARAIEKGDMRRKG